MVRRILRAVTRLSRIEGYMPSLSAIIAIELCASALPANAASPLESTAPMANPGQFQAQEENDVFYYGAPKNQRTDQWYTQGLRFEWVHPSNEDQFFAADIPANFWCSLLCGKDYDTGFTNSGWAFGQNIYTPHDISIPVSQPQERPWAGYLYGGRVSKQSYIVRSWSAERQDKFEIDLGVVGPLALGREAQNTIHHILGIGGGKGWDNQLANEPTFLARFESVLRFPACGRFYDVEPYARAFLGTVLTAADVGATARLGYNLAGFAPGVINPSIQLAEANAGNRVSDASPKRTVYCDSPPTDQGFLSAFAVFGRIQARAVAYNIFLDGNVFHDSPSVSKHTMVYESAAGFDAALGGGWGLAFQLVNRTAEFPAPSGHGVQRFGAVQLHRVIQ
jgi:lipid A 3-O-deacylase